MSAHNFLRRGRKFVAGAVRPLLWATLAAGLVSSPAHAQPIWPTRTVTLVVPFPAGGATDTLARVLAKALTSETGQTVVVDNRAGAAGAIGSSSVEKAAPDGYTLLLATSSTHSILPHLTTKLPFNAATDFTPIAQVAEGASLLVISPTLAVTTIAELITYGKNNPGKLNYGSSGIGSIPHLNGAYFAGLAGIQMTHVPYKGSSLAYPDLKTGRVQLMIDSIVTALPQARGGTVKALGTTDVRRSALAPEVPTIAESGLPTFQSKVWFGILGPKKMDPKLVDTIAAALAKALQSNEVVAQYADLGVDVSPQGPARFEKTIASESDKWKRVIVEHNVVAE